MGTRSPTWTTAVERKGAVIRTPAYARYPFTAGWTGGGGRRQRKKIGQYPSASGGARTHDPWIMSQCTNHFTNQAHTYTHTCMHAHSYQGTRVSSCPQPTLQLWVLLAYYTVGALSGVLLVLSLKVHMLEH